jgi:hypothetical protein
VTSWPDCWPKGVVAIVAVGITALEVGVVLPLSLVVIGFPFT